MGRPLFVYARDTKQHEVNKTNGRHSNLIATKEDMGAEGFIVGLHTMDPGGFAPEHAHEEEQEAMVFFSGNGVASVDGREYPIEPESVMLAPAGVKHAIRNTGPGPLKFAFIYSPPLPEHVSRNQYYARARDTLPAGA